MAIFLLTTHLLLGALEWGMSPDTTAALNKRGLSTRPSDFSAIMDAAFEKQDRELVTALVESLFLEVAPVFWTVG